MNESDPEAAPVPEPEKILFREPACAIDWGRSRLTPAMACAIASAQAAIRTVGKGAMNTDQKYKYATADSVVAEFRTAFAANGVALLGSWRLFDPPFTRISDKQWVDWTVVLDWALVHGTPGAGIDDHAGMLVGTASCIAIGSAGRPPDKSMMAARTAIHGALAITLGAIDRAVVEDAEDIGQRRGDDDARPTRGRTTGNASTEDLRTEGERSIRILVAARRAAGDRGLDGKPLRVEEAMETLMGVGWKPTVDADWIELATACAVEIEKIRQKAENR